MDQTQKVTESNKTLELSKISATSTNHTNLTMKTICQYVNKAQAETKRGLHDRKTST